MQAGIFQCHDEHLELLSSAAHAPKAGLRLAQDVVSFTILADSMSYQAGVQLVDGRGQAHWSVELEVQGRALVFVEQVGHALFPGLGAACCGPHDLKQAVDALVQGLGQHA